MTIQYTNIFHCKTLQNLPKSGFFGLKICHLATLLPMEMFVVLFGTKSIAGETSMSIFCKRLQERLFPPATQLKYIFFMNFTTYLKSILTKQIDLKI
jgi:hypothetical protein